MIYAAFFALAVTVAVESYALYLAIRKSRYDEGRFWTNIGMLLVLVAIFCILLPV